VGQCFGPVSTGSVTRWFDRAPFHHEDDRSFRRSRPVDHSSRDRKPLVRSERYRPALQVNQQRALQDEEELVLLVVLVPVEFPFQDTEPNHAVVDATEGLVEPPLLARRDEAWHIDELEKTELHVQVDVVIGLLAHCIPRLLLEQGG
jgi:hypothetical protein